MTAIKNLIRPPYWPGLFSFLLATGVGLAWANHFLEAYILLAACLAWAELLWLNSDNLLSSKAKSERLPAKRRRFSHEEIAAIMRRKKVRYRAKKWGLFAGIAVIGAVFLLEVGDWNYQWELQQAFGTLIPANDPTPPELCRENGVPASTLSNGSRMSIFAGTNVYSESRLDHLALVQINGVTVLSLSKTRGAVAVSGDIYSGTGDLVHFDQNHFETRSDIGFKPERPDRHTLRVFDNWHQEVLYIRFLNSSAIKLRGVFWVPGAIGPVQVTDDYVRTPGSISSHACTYDPLGGVAIKINGTNISE
jgi:hypothetical protein